MDNHFDRNGDDAKASDNRLGDESVAQRVFCLLIVLALVLGFIAGACTVTLYADSCESLTTKYTDTNGGPDVVCGNKGCKYVDTVQP